MKSDHSLAWTLYTENFIKAHFLTHSVICCPVLTAPRPSSDKSGLLHSTMVRAVVFPTKPSFISTPFPTPATNLLSLFSNPLRGNLHYSSKPHLISILQQSNIKNPCSSIQFKEFKGCSCTKFETLSHGKEEEFVVVNFYKFVFIKDPEFEVAKHLSFLEDQGMDIHGRIYMNEQGINAQYSGPSEDALAYLKWLRHDQRFSDILVQLSPAKYGHAFPRLKLRYKPSLVQLEGGVSHLPLLDPSMRATPLSPSEWKRKLQEEKDKYDESDVNAKRNLIVLDVRNGYEWDIGHFHGAQRPDVDCFRSTTFGLAHMKVNNSDPLAMADKENTDILMYCTGGIRCDVYSTILRQKGFRNLYTLKGGVSHYFEKEGPIGWVGNLFVFDSRLSLPPSVYETESTVAASKTEQVPDNCTFARCYLCGSQLSELRHRNCANLDCNLLFLCCMNCVNELQGCCCSDCKSAPRLRPVLHGHERYRKWHIYRD